MPLTEETRTTLERYLDERPLTGGPVIRSYLRPQDGLRADTISTLVSGWMTAGGIKHRPRDGVSAHSLRHSAATDMLRSGAHLRDVQAALGHASLQTTQRYMPTAVNDLRTAMGGRHYRGRTAS